ncbi:hypothetical protein BJX66DRAFT_353167 [Aspergillus keveii]|uniref:Zn(2)-C6 fungal-type domain-containing protein n=1 Tax=Aspergillus keveii TaxID=714993 RepID=A0ABR4FX02_9EURO
MARRSCDRCYAIKAKCQPGRGHDTCRRCERLGHECETVRSVRKIGRPRATRSTSQNSPDSGSSIGSSDLIIAESPSPISIPAIILDPQEAETQRPLALLLQQPHPIPSLSQSLTHASEKSILEFLFSTTHFIPHFIIGPSFANSMQHSLQARFYVSSEILLEGFLACAAEFKNITLSTLALHKLRLLHATDIPTISTMLALGTSILTYDQLASLEGASMICRYLLSQVKPWYARLVQYSELDFELNCLIYLDTVECALRREVPVLRLRVRGEGVVDRYVGLVYGLLPLLYDVCVLGWEIRKDGGFGRGEGVEERWEKARGSIADWQPSPPDNITSIYTAKEIIAMCTQANIYRQLGLLLLHRQRYHFGTEDIAATAYAQAIFAEVETCSRLAGETPFKIGFPLLVAAFELGGLSSREELIQRHFSARVRKLLRIVWRERDTKENVSWFDVVSGLPKFGYIP